ncbi:alpha amylase C-terminal domain-containing protein [Kineosporia sp. J2-2]|uniref:Alpha-amylase n=1 Tax=Kineosporia corallincola TaxID=2835133 RepID=A0ABS5TB76_9ACTN|nr:alpha-amylase family protein [Kineosporia corallincola]MBT0768316.1 alpha amylase C-terminal domain-containing protein [Kineosporia corallincola]
MSAQRPTHRSAQQSTQQSAGHATPSSARPATPSAGHLPGSSPGYAAGSPPSHSPGNAPGNSPGHSAGRSPGHSATRRSTQGSGQAPDGHPAQRPGRRASRAARPVLAALAVVAAVGLSVAGVSAVDGLGGTREPGITPLKASGRSDVMANLFEWNWNSVASECTRVLGPAGYAGVQVSQPADSLRRTALGDGSDTVLHPWWEIYQPVSYELTSRMGTEAEFRAMVRTCRAAGVKVYVDAVVNHMTGQGSVSYGGTEYSHFAYDGLYDAADFHHRGEECSSSTGGIEDFNNLRQVRYCELVGLADLDTSDPHVRDTLAAYLNKLLGYGVSGFRVDAAKHVGQDDLIALRKKLHRTVDGDRPYVALEVFGGGPGSLSPQAFTEAGSAVLGLDADIQIKNAFKSYPADGTGSLATLRDFGEGSGLTPGDKTLSFVQNHDTERNGDSLNYKDGATNLLAQQFLLAYGYGTPQVYSSFAWETTDASPPSGKDGLITDTDCSDAAWVCVHADAAVTGMVGFHNRVGDAAVRNWWDDGGNLIAFGRGRAGWVALNNDRAAHTRTFSTGLPAGTYCNVTTGVARGGRCSGPTVRVAGDGTAEVTVPAKGAVAFTRADRV